MEKIIYETFPLSAQVEALTTTTLLGNLAYQVDDGNNVDANRHALADSIGIPLRRFVFVHQSHSDRVMKVTLNDLGRGKDSFEDGLDCDALYTYEKQVPLCVFHADCVPIFFVNEKASLVGIIHAGFKGTMKHVTYKVMKEICEKEKLNVADFKFYIGPFRQPYSFKVDNDSRLLILEAGFEKALNNDEFDNGLANKLDLFELGVKESQIASCDYDTVTNLRFFSAIRKIPVGRLVSLIYLK